MTCDAIVNAAARVLSTEGIDRCSTNRIAEVAGVSIGSVYEYFENKQAIIDAVALQHLDRISSMFDNAIVVLGDNADLQTVVRVLVEAVIAAHDHDVRLHRSLSQEVPLSEHVLRKAEEFKHRTVLSIQRLLGDHLGTSDLSAQIVFDSVDSIVHRWVRDDEHKPVPKERLSAELIRLLEGYLTYR